MGEENEDIIFLKYGDISIAINKNITQEDIDNLITDRLIQPEHVQGYNVFSGDVNPIIRTLNSDYTDKCCLSLSQKDIDTIRRLQEETILLRQLLFKLLLNPAIKSIINLTINDKDTTIQEDKSNS